MERSKGNAGVNVGDQCHSVLDSLFEELPEASLTGSYDAQTQTWSHRNSAQFSPVKNNQES